VRMNLRVFVINIMYRGKLCGERPETRNSVTEKQSIREQRILLRQKALKCCREENRSVVCMYEFYIQSFHISY